MPVAVKLLLGLMTLWGTVYAFAALVGDFPLVSPPGSGRVEPSGLEAAVLYLHAANALLIFLIDAFLVLNLGSLRVSRRVTWVFVMMFLYPIALPAFWYLHIWRAPRATAPRASDAAADDA
jgi:hypothetical protein